MDMNWKPQMSQMAQIKPNSGFSLFICGHLRHLRLQIWS